MTARSASLIAIALMIALSFVFQIQLKGLANTIAPIFSRSDLGNTERLALAAKVLVSWRSLYIVGIALLLFLLWFFALMRLDLSVALPIASLALVLNSVGGGMFLGEPLTWVRVGGISAVAFGVFLVIKS